jgi:uncharacterized C2H2 Zn-finger protein
VLVERVSGFLVPTQPLITAADYVEESEGAEETGRQDTGSQASPRASPVRVGTDLQDLPFNVIQQGDKFQVDAVTWKGICNVLRANTAILKGMEKTGSLELPAVSEGDTTCGVCGRKFAKVRHLKKHMSTAHAGEGRKSCPSCEKTFSSSSVLKVHLKSHSAPKRKAGEFKCLHCDESFEASWALGSHMRRQHPGVGTYACKHSGCDRMFQSANSRNAHSSSCQKNPNFKWKVCIYKGCDATFARQYDLNRHMARKHGWKKS